MPSGIYKRHNHQGFQKRHPDFVSKEGRISQSLLTSAEKNYMWKGGRPNCIVCGKQLVSYKAKHCKSCATKKRMTIETRKQISKKMRGKNNPFWKNGISTENHKIRRSVEIRLWRESVFERDNWTCQKCDRRSKKEDRVILHSHHIKNFAKYPELRTSIENGITLCKKCHNGFHKKYGVKNNTIKQLKEFLIKRKLC